ncbi:MAG TPA: PilZ domain-containing protein [Candidatus Acidoferrum sp.]|nr:PilZ domain-containing protein [Candidatus Acidoferrum sp.]
MEQERRRSPRYPFIANAEVTEAQSQARMQTRVSEISLYGCYFDMVNPLPDGTVVHVKIFCDDGFFEADGTVIYSQPNFGMGVTFREVQPFYMTTLKKWLLKAMLAGKSS